MPWTAERDDALRRMIGEKKTFSQIAAELNVSRNAVIGRAHRLGIRTKNPPHKIRRILNARPAPAPKRRPVFAPVPKLTREEAVLRCAAVEPLHVGLMELQHHHCRYPYGDVVPFTFCGRPKIDGWAYCAAHAAICVNDVSTKRDLTWRRRRKATASGRVTTRR